MPCEHHPLHPASMFNIYRNPNLPVHPLHSHLAFKVHSPAQASWKAPIETYETTIQLQILHSLSASQVFHSGGVQIQTLACWNSCGAQFWQQNWTLLVLMKVLLLHGWWWRFRNQQRSIHSSAARFSSLINTWVWRMCSKKWRCPSHLAAVKGRAGRWWRFEMWTDYIHIRHPVSKPLVSIHHINNASNKPIWPTWNCK